MFSQIHIKADLRPFEPFLGKFSHTSNLFADIVQITSELHHYTPRPPMHTTTPASLESTQRCLECCLTTSTKHRPEVESDVA